MNALVFVWVALLLVIGLGFAYFSLRGTPAGLTILETWYKVVATVKGWFSKK